MSFYIYENWRAKGRHVAKVHVGDCAFCNHGDGFRGGTRADNGRWRPEGPPGFKTAAEAMAVAEGLVGEAATWCGHCRPHEA